MNSRASTSPRAKAHNMKQLPYVKSPGPLNLSSSSSSPRQGKRKANSGGEGSSRANLLPTSSLMTMENEFDMMGNGQMLQQGSWASYANTHPETSPYAHTMSVSCIFPLKYSSLSFTVFVLCCLRCWLVMRIFNMCECN